MPVQDADVDMGKAYLDIAAAEEQAALLEDQLRSLERKIGAFLDEHDKPEPTTTTSTDESPPPSDGPSTTTDSVKMDGT